jgi:hypothetical protein
MAVTARPAAEVFRNERRLNALIEVTTYVSLWEVD